MSRILISIVCINICCKWGAFGVSSLTISLHFGFIYSPVVEVFNSPQKVSLKWMVRCQALERKFGLKEDLLEISFCPFWLVFMICVRLVDDITIVTVLCYYLKQLDSKLPCVCSLVDHRRQQNMVRTSVMHTSVPCVPFLFLTHFDMICDLFLNRSMSTWNLFMKLIIDY